MIGWMGASEVLVFFEKELSIRQIFQTQDFSVTSVNKILVCLIKEVKNGVWNSKAGLKPLKPLSIYGLW